MRTSLHHTQCRADQGLQVNLSQVLPADIGAAAAYEAYRVYKYRRQHVFDPLGQDIERQREALIAMAIAESASFPLLSPSAYELTPVQRRSSGSTRGARSTRTASRTRRRQRRPRRRASRAGSSFRRTYRRTRWAWACPELWEAWLEEWGAWVQEWEVWVQEWEAWAPEWEA